MLNILEDYIWRSLPEWDDFATNPNLRKKVAGDGSFLPFYGNTTVFDLAAEAREALTELQTLLYAYAGFLLAQKLDPATFHMTLHDLENGSEYSDALQLRMQVAEGRVKQMLTQWKTGKPLRMKATWLFNMVNTSIVLGLTPADEVSRQRLDEMYMALESVVPLGYALTPHITMAYFKPGIYSQQELDCLRQALRPVELEVELRMENLVYQEFFDMNHYENR